MKKVIGYRLWVIMAAIGCLLPVGCHHKQKPPEETIPDSVPDTIVVSAPAGQEPEQACRIHQLHTDTATRVDLKTFSRRQKVIYSPAMLVGRWLNGSLYEEYDANGYGRSWDTADDVTSDEAKRFQWMMDSNLLHVEYPITTGGVVPREYLVTYADDESLVYKDDFGTSYMWDKVTKE